METFEESQYFLFLLVIQLKLACKDRSQTEFEAISHQALSIFYMAWAIKVYSHWISKNHVRFFGLDSSWKT